MTRGDIALLILALALLIWPAKVMLYGESWTWLPALNGIGGICCAAAATADWRRKGG